jgi:MraZ protein
VADQVVENGVLTGVGAEAPNSIAQARVDDKGRLKLPAEYLEYLKKLGVDKVFVTTVDLVLGRIYPISVWKANENLFSNAGDLAELAEDVAYIAKYYGGNSEIDAQGRILVPTELRRKLGLESQPVWLDFYNGRINIAGKAVHDARLNRAQVNLFDKVKTLEKKGLK